MKSSVILAVVIFSSVISSSSQFKRNPGGADLDTLELVQVIYRHGDRTPTEAYPTSPNSNESVWYPYADGFGALTKKGRQQQYELGKYWRYRYDGFVDEVYSSKEIIAISSDVDRTIMSCLADLAGMWPPNPKDSKSEWSPNIGWQPIPVHTVPMKSDNYIGLFAKCPRLDEVTAESRANSSFVKSINEDPENQALYKYLSKHLGMKIDDFRVVGHFQESIMIEKSYGLMIPAWVENGTVLAQMVKLDPLAFDARSLIPNVEAKRLKAGPLLHFLVKNMDVKRGHPMNSQAETDALPEAKMVMLSSHDITMASLLGAIGVFEAQRPPYASAAILEMHKGLRGQSPNERFVRIFYRNETTPLSTPNEFEIPGCGYPCNLDKFKELFSNIIISDADWWKACVADETADL